MEQKEYKLEKLIKIRKQLRKIVLNNNIETAAEIDKVISKINKMIDKEKNIDFKGK